VRTNAPGQSGLATAEAAYASSGGFGRVCYRLNQPLNWEKFYRNEFEPLFRPKIRNVQAVAFRMAK